MNPDSKILERFRAKYAVDDTGCWRWTAALDKDGYGQFKAGGRTRQAHIWRWEQETGNALPKGYELDHLCRLRSCVNPAHLELVTHAENVKRAREAQARLKKPCAAEGCEDSSVPNPKGGRPTKYCLRHQKHKDRTRRRLREEGLLETPASNNEYRARKLALLLGLSNGDESAAIALAKVLSPDAEALLARAKSADLKGLRDRSPAAMGDLFAVSAGLAALTAMERIDSFEPSENLRVISESVKASEQFGAHGGKTTYPVINVIFPE